MASKTPERITAKFMQERLRRHYIAPGDLPGGVYLPEVTMGSAGGGRADGLYVGFTSTRGHRLVGHEIKVTRADWLHELDQPEKAEVWASQCHAWYIVAPDTKMVRPEELPEGWGLMVLNSRTATRMDVVVKAAVHADRTPSWTAMHSIVKRQDTLRAQAIASARAKARDDAKDAMEVELGKRLANGGSSTDFQARYEANEALLADIAKALGVRGISHRGYGWNDFISVPEIDAAFGRYVLADRDIDKALLRRARTLRNMRMEFDNAANELRRIEETVSDASSEA
tara:strand:+ start:19367 stop:20221 length:855 start_codon:yes stop_codon:yes gene_type:complete